jgi:hypothetical protein
MARPYSPTYAIPLSKLIKKDNLLFFKSLNASKSVKTLFALYSNSGERLAIFPPVPRAVVNPLNSILLLWRFSKPLDISKNNNCSKCHILFGHRTIIPSRNLTRPQIVLIICSYLSAFLCHSKYL